MEDCFTYYDEHDVLCYFYGTYQEFKQFKKENNY